MRHVLRVLCCLGYYYEKMGKESNPFLILTLATASKWLDKQILVSSRSQRGQPLEAGKTLFISPCLVPREVYRPQRRHEMPPKSAEAARLSPTPGMLSGAHVKALKVLNSC